MRKVKWIFFAYMALVALILCGIGLSFALVPARDPDTLYASITSTIPTMDPPRIQDVPGAEVGGYMWECLYNYDYYKRPVTVIPELAEAMPLISPDGKTVTIKIKKGIHFFDPHGGITSWETVTNEAGKVVGRKGPELTAGDFIYAWKRICNFHLDSQWYAAMFEGKVVGVEEFRAYTQKAEKNAVDYSRPIEGFAAPDSYTIVIKLRDPFPQLIYNLAHLPSAPVSREAVDTYKDDIKFKPVATGPYYLADHRPDERIVLEANPLYRGAPDAASDNSIPPAERLPYAKRVRIDYFEEDLPAWALFQQAMLDVSPIPKDSFTVAIDPGSRGLRSSQKSKGIELIKGIDPTVFFYGLNMADPIVGKNKPLRQAMSMALNRQEYIDLMMNGRGIPAKGPIPPEFPTYDENAKNPYTEFDLVAARQKMKEAVKVNGGPIPEISLIMGDTSTTARQSAELTVNHMAKIGLKVRVDYRTWPRFLEMVDSKQAQFFSLGWQADYPDEQTFFQLFYSKNQSPGPNSSNYNNPEYDALYEKSVVLGPGPERNELYRKMSALVQEDCPVIFNCIRINFRLNYDWVSNIKPNEYRHGNRAYHKLDVAKRQAELPKAKHGGRV
jgi:oligopeptide transport system substrate-binding protein